MTCTLAQSRGVPDPSWLRLLGHRVPPRAAPVSAAGAGPGSPGGGGAASERRCRAAEPGGAGASRCLPPEPARSGPGGDGMPVPVPVPVEIGSRSGSRALGWGSGSKQNHGIRGVRELQARSSKPGPASERGTGHFTAPVPSGRAMAPGLELGRHGRARGAAEKAAGAGAGCRARVRIWDAAPGCRWRGV